MWTWYRILYAFARIEENIETREKYAKWQQNIGEAKKLNGKKENKYSKMENAIEAWASQNEIKLNERKETEPAAEKEKKIMKWNNFCAIENENYMYTNVDVVASLETIGRNTFVYRLECEKCERREKILRVCWFRFQNAISQLSKNSDRQKWERKRKIVKINPTIKA